MSGKDFVKELQSNGWVHKRTKGSHYIMVKGSKEISVPVHKNEDLKKGLYEKLKKVAGLK